MSIQQIFPNREQVDVDKTWDISEIFPNEMAFYKALETVKKLTDIFCDKYKNCSNTTSEIMTGIYDLSEIKEKLSQIEHYAFLPIEANRHDEQAAARYHQANQVILQTEKAIQFFTLELIQQDETVLNEMSTLDEEITPFIKQILKEKKTTLKTKEEETLLAFKNVFDQPYEIYNQAKLADMAFPDFYVDGRQYPLSFVLYEDLYMYSEDTAVRREAFKVFSETLKKYENTIATAYYTHVSQEKAEATLRGFDSVVDYLLYNQGVSREWYDRQIDGIMSGLAPVMRKYAQHIKEERGLDEMTFADLKIDLDPEFDVPVTFQEAEGYIKKAMAVMGADYFTHIAPAFTDRWVDYAQNKGKSTGGFCTKPAQTHPYILMSWTNQLSDVYTLIHELGHANQMLQAEKNNLYLTSEPSLYLIEAPSTFNELLLTGYLMDTASDVRTQRYARTKMLTNTYFHNFVTHLLEAAYQREVYRLIDEGKSFTAQTLSQLKRGILEQFWGNAVEINPGAELTWMRQPHYYMGLYSYTYSAGLTIATEAFLNIRKNKTDAVSKWLQFLDLGKKDIKNAADLAGVDITTDAPLKHTIAFLSDTVDEIIVYSNDMKGE